MMGARKWRVADAIYGKTFACGTTTASVNVAAKPTTVQYRKETVE